MTGTVPRSSVDDDFATLVIPPGWRPIRPGPGPTVVMIDFGAGRAGAGAAELAVALPPPWHVIAPAFGRSTDAVTDPAMTVAAWRDTLAKAGVAVHGVLALCAGSALAESLVVAVMPPAPLVLIEPTVVDGPLLARRFAEVTAPLADVLPPGSIDAQQGWATREAAAVTDGASLLALAGRFAARYRTLVMEAGDELGLDAETAAGMAARTDAFLGYLALAGHAATAGPVLTPDHQLTVLAPAGHPVPERYRGSGRHRTVTAPLRQLPSDLVAAVVAALTPEVDR